MRTPVSSKAAVYGHPIHPMLIVFPVAFLIGAFATDLVWWATGTPFWAEASRWLIGAGLVMGALAGLAGFADYVSRPEVRSHLAAHVHLAGNAVVLILAIINLVLRLGNATDAILPWGVVISGVTTAILGLTGWLGGELAYRYGIGQMEEPVVFMASGAPQSTPPAANEPVEEARRRRSR